jgi:hypothetical protein
MENKMGKNEVDILIWIMRGLIERRKKKEERRKKKEERRKKKEERRKKKEKRKKERRLVNLDRECRGMLNHLPL